MEAQLARWTREVLVTFALIVAGLAVLLVANWLVLEPEAIRATDATRAAREVHEGLLLQESALRAYVLTGDDTFKGLLEDGREMVAEALPDLDRLAHEGNAGGLLLDARLAQEAWTERWVPRALEAGESGVEGAELRELLVEGRDRFTTYRLARDRLIEELIRQRDGAQRRQSLAIAWTVGAALALTAALGTRAWRRGRQLRRSVEGPLQELLERIGRLQAGDLSPEPPLTGPAELVRIDRGLSLATASLAQAKEDLETQAERIATQNRDLGEVLNVAREIAGSLNLRYVVRGVVDAAAAISGRPAVVWLLTEDGEQLVAMADSAGPGGEALGHEPRGLGEGRVGRAARFGRIEGRGLDRAAPEAEVAIPMVVGAKVVGVLELCADGTTLADSTVDMVEALAVQAASAVASARMLETTEALARTDALTNLPNRRQLDTDLATEVEVSARHGRPLGFAMLDIDHFKAYNDTLGHQAGDVALQEVARLLAESVRAGDHVYRYGGEELAVLMRETDAEEACHLLERLRKAVEHHFTSPDQPRPVTVSVGVAAMPDHARTGSELVHAADAALYVAKRSGRNRVVVAEPAVVAPRGPLSPSDDPPPGGPPPPG